MTEQFSVRITQDDAATRLHRSILASLPNHFRVVATGSADAVLLTNPADAADGARIAVVDGSALPRSDMIAVPALQFAPRLRAETTISGRTDYALIEMVATVGALDKITDTLVEQLAVLRLLSGGRPRIVSAERLATGISATANLEGRPTVATLAVIVSPIGSARLTATALASSHRLEIDLDVDAIARPALVRRFDADGVTEGTPLYQSGHRLTWLSVHAALAGSSVSNDYRGAEWREDRAEAEHCWPS